VRRFVNTKIYGLHKIDATAVVMRDGKPTGESRTFRGGSPWSLRAMVKVLRFCDAFDWYTTEAVNDIVALYKKVRDWLWPKK
jgi:hypothetical protein